MHRRTLRDDILQKPIEQLGPVLHTQLGIRCELLRDEIGRSAAPGTHFTERVEDGVEVDQDLPLGDFGDVV